MYDRLANEWQPGSGQPFQVFKRCDTMHAPTSIQKIGFHGDSGVVIAGVNDHGADGRLARQEIGDFPSCSGVIRLGKGVTWVQIVIQANTNEA